MRMRDISIRGRILLSFGVMMVVLGLVGAIVALSARLTQQEVATGRDIQRFDSAVIAMQAAAVRQREAVLAYVISGQGDRLEGYEAAHQEFLTALGDARAVPSMALTGGLAPVATALEAWRDDVVARQIRLMRNPLTADEARLLEATGQAPAAFAAVLGALDGLKQASEAARLDSQGWVDQKLTVMLLTSIFGALAGLIAAAVAVVFLIRSLSVPLRALTDDMLVIARGDFGVTVGHRDRKDEIGGMAGALEVFRANLEETARLKEAEQNLRLEQEAKARQLEDAIRGFDGEMGGLMRHLSDAVSGLDQASGTAANMAEEVRRSTGAAAQASDRTTSNAREVAAAAEQLSASVHEIAQRVSQSSKIAEDAVRRADATGQTVRSLNEAAQQIGEIVTLISDIAEQTNLLALNATIESARAGEAGKGFAVVASEVKNLATQTGRATEDIARRIRDIQGMTESAVTAMGQVGDVIRSVNDIALTISAAVEEQGAAASTIARNINEAVDGSAEVTANMTGIAGATEQAQRSSVAVRDASQGIAEANRGLKQAFDGFIRTVRTA